MKHILIYALLLCFGLAPVMVSGQELPSDEDMYDLSLEDLMNIPIHSASKKEETLFDAPLSSYTVTRADIEKSGATSVMEALRLVPGLIVREQANGVYDIHIRGLDNILRNSWAFTKNNLLTLVMIDSRPAFNHNLGGTFWEALPIDVMDVERIEIVRGPSAPLFGPNAVTGVVNIITTRPSSEKTIVSANVEGGMAGTLIANAYAGKKLSRKFSTAFSFNHQERDRFSKSFYNSETGTYQAGSTFIPEFGSSFPDESQAMKKTGVNAYFQFAPAEKTVFDLSAGYQSNQALKNMLGSFGTVLNNTESNSVYTNISAKVSAISLRTSFVAGTDNILYGGSPSTYDYQVSDLNVEYAVKVGKKMQVVPGVNFQNAVFDDSEYFPEAQVGFLSGTKQTITTSSAFVRTDIDVTSKWRVLAALRADKFSAPDDIYLAYEFASTYRPDKNNLLRVAVTRSNSGAFMGYTKTDIREEGRFNRIPGLALDQVQRGTEDLSLLTVNMVEAGYRAKLSNALQLDVDVFYQRLENPSTLVVKGFTSYPPSPDADFLVEFDNVPVTASQLGATMSLNWVPDAKWQVKPFVTFQSTNTDNLPNAYNDPSLSTTQGLFFPQPVTYADSRHKYTPSVYGGYYINYKAGEKVNINANGYFLGAQTWYRAATLSNQEMTVTSEPVFLFNIRASYALTKSLNVYVNGRNVLNNENRQFLGADTSGALVMGGLSLNVR